MEPEPDMELRIGVPDKKVIGYRFFGFQPFGCRIQVGDQNFVGAFVSGLYFEKEPLATRDECSLHRFFNLD